MDRELLKEKIRVSFTKEDGTKYGKRECVELTQEQLKELYPDLYKELFEV